MAQLPGIELTCRYEHSFTSHAKGGVSVSCPVCRKAGNRVQVWVSRNRPRTEREARDRAALTTPAEPPAANVDPELSARWEREAPWTGGLVTLAGRPADECGECGGPLQWEPGRTVVHCSECKGLTLPAAVAEHYRRQDRRSAEVATRTAPDESAERAARVQLRALAQRMNERVAEWVGVFDPDGLNGNAARLARDYQAELTAYLPEIRHAKDRAELAEIMTEVTEVTDRAQRSGALADIERQREAIERLADRADQAAEREARERAEVEAARQAERIKREAARQAEATRAERKVIPGAIERPVVPAGYVGLAAMLAQMITDRQAHKPRRQIPRAAIPGPADPPPDPEPYNMTDWGY